MVATKIYLKAIWSEKIPRASEQLSPCTTITEPYLKAVWNVTPSKWDFISSTMQTSFEIFSPTVCALPAVHISSLFFQTPQISQVHITAQSWPPAPPYSFSHFLLNSVPPEMLASPPGFSPADLGYSLFCPTSRFCKRRTRRASQQLSCTGGKSKRLWTVPAFFPINYTGKGLRPGHSKENDQQVVH